MEKKKNYKRGRIKLFQIMLDNLIDNNNQILKN